MTGLPAPSAPTGVQRAPAGEPYGPDNGDEIRLQDALALVRRNRWLITACTALVLGAAGVLTFRATPVYQAAASLQIVPREPNLPEVFRSLSRTADELVTEADVLRSRAIAEDVVDRLGLQVRLLRPARVRRGALIDSIVVSPTAAAGVYQVRRQAGRLVVRDVERGRRWQTTPHEGWIALPGAKLRLAHRAAGYPVLQIGVSSRTRAAQALQEAVTIRQQSRDGNILDVAYQDTDRDLVWQVPNAIVDRYFARRRAVQTSETKGVVEFLRRQLDTVSVQLAAAEDELRGYRERQRVVAPQAEATGEVNRVMALESERSGIEAERAALADLLAAADRKSAMQKPEDPSPYRDLLAFPSLLRNQAARDVLANLTRVEEERRQLLERRTPVDPDVRALTARVDELQAQLRSVVATYLQGLTEQAASLKSTLEGYRQQLSAVPQRELELARRERKARVLEQVYNLLQTRLKESEISGTAADPGVRLLDTAVEPRLPIKPRRALNMLAGLIGGVLLGFGAAIARELWDHAIRTRADVQAATGLPVLGFIPRIRGSRKGIALIVDPQRRPRGEPDPAPAHAGDHSTRSYRQWYTFLPVTATQQSHAGRRSNGTPIPQLVVSNRGLGAAEALSSVHINITLANPDRELKALMVTSPLPGEGKTTSAVNFAVALTRRGMKVALADADLRRGIVHEAFQAARQPGMVELLREEVSIDDACRVVKIDGRELHYFTAGAGVRTPSALLGSPVARRLLTELRRRYDIVVIDCPPANVVADAALVSALADAVIIVARAGVTDAGALTYALEQLQRVRASVLGVLLNDIEPRRDAAYDAAYRYYNYKRYIGAEA